MNVVTVVGCIVVGVYTQTFAADELPPVPDGFARTFFFYSVGWDKDGDYNVVGGDRVGPLPVADDVILRDEEQTDTGWRIQYNTRWVPRDRFRPKR